MRKLGPPVHVLGPREACCGRWAGAAVVGAHVQVLCVSGAHCCWVCCSVQRRSWGIVRHDCCHGMLPCFRHTPWDMSASLSSYVDFLRPAVRQ